jgi:hypothetical protein
MRSKVATIALKVAVSFVVMIASIMVANVISKDVLGHTYGSPSLPMVFLAGTILPIWFSGTVLQKVLAAVGGVIAGLLVWFAIFKAGAALVSGIVSVLIIKKIQTAKFADEKSVAN